MVSGPGEELELIPETGLSNTENFRLQAQSQQQKALLDIVNGALRIRLWGLLGWLDIKLRYRRSMLGPLWLTISMGALVGSIGLLYAGLFKLEVASFLPHLTLGFLIWYLISGIITESCNAFIAAESSIKKVSLPFSLSIYRLIWRNLIIFAHNALNYVIVAVIFAIWPGWLGWLAIPGLLLVALNSVWVGLFLATVCARYRDVAQIVGSLLQLSFFLTPIIWVSHDNMTGMRAAVLQLNPFFHAMEVTRAPLLGQAPSLTSWVAMIGMAIVGNLAVFLFFSRYRRRIAYWV